MQKLKKHKDSNISINSVRSSVLISGASIALMLGLGFAFLFFGAYRAAVFPVAVAAVCFVSRVWAANSLNNIDFTADCDRFGFFPEDNCCISLSIKNKKRLPLLWFELLIPLGISPVMRPENETDIFKPDELSHIKADIPDGETVKKKFAFLSPGEELKWKLELKAVRRGLFAISDIRMRSGDGFGLAICSMPLKNTGRTLAVYPKRIRVNAAALARNQWESGGGGKGYMEDISVIRGSRNYQPADSWKRINFRLAARGLPLTVNLYDMILPKSVHFIVDGESFSGADADREGFEDMLSILGSIIMELKSGGMSCALSLPQSLHSGAVSLRQDCGTAELMYALAAYELLPYTNPTAEEKAKAEAEAKRLKTDTGKFIERLMHSYSVFDTASALSVSQDAGKIYYVTRFPAFSENALTRRLNQSKLVVLPYEEQGAGNGAGFKQIPLRSLKV